MLLCSELYSLRIKEIVALWMSQGVVLKLP
jgi:hypothetical protein